MTGYITPDEYQSKVINSTDKDILVLAGAGSGKTFTLLNKIHKLVTRDNVDPKKILVLTFTRVACEHMKQKYIDMIGKFSSDVPDFYTFHAFCYKVLSEYKQVQKALGYSELPSIVDDQGMSKYQIKAKSLSSCRVSYGRLKHYNELRGKEKRQADNYYRILNKLIKADNVIDYDSLSEKICSLISKKDASVLPVIEEYRYLLVDEFQDTDSHQYQFVKSMDHCHRVLCGDALQNIYQFRGCSNKPLKDLCSDNSWVKLVLPVNYRSSKQICQYVNNLSKDFHSRDYRIVLKSNAYGPSVRVYDTSLKNDMECTEDLIRYLNKVNSEKTVAVLCRTNLEVSKISNDLKCKGIKCSRSSTSEYFIEVIKSTVDKEYSYKFFQYLMNDQDYSVYKSFKLEDIADKDIFSPSYYRYWSSSVTQAIQDVNIIESVRSWDLEQSTFCLCDMFEVDQPVSCVKSFDDLMQYLLDSVQSKKDPNVYVGTIHSVKGLEFDSVVVMNVGGTHFKINKEETENLLYTACTRAKRNLMIFEYGEK